MKKAFSLFELVLVIIIIVLLIALLVKVNSLIKTTKIKTFYNSCIKAWITKCNDFYSRAGVPLGSPLYMKQNGKVVKIDSITGGDIPYSKNKLNFDFVLRSPEYIIFQLESFGIGTKDLKEACFAPSSKGVTKIVVSAGADILSFNETKTICLDSNCNSSYILTGVSSKNAPFLVFINLPYDVAIAVDREIDGQSNGKKGYFLCLNSYSSLLDIESSKVDDIIKIKGLEDYSSFNCGGTLFWGNESNPYVTAAYLIK